jgi:hypothetical protein
MVNANFAPSPCCCSTWCERNRTKQGYFRQTATVHSFIIVFWCATLVTPLSLPLLKFAWSTCWCALHDARTKFRRNPSFVSELVSRADTKTSRCCKPKKAGPHPPVGQGVTFNRGGSWPTIARSWGEHGKPNEKIVDKARFFIASLLSVGTFERHLRHT